MERESALGTLGGVSPGVSPALALWVVPVTPVRPNGIVLSLPVLFVLLALVTLLLFVSVYSVRLMVAASVMGGSEQVGTGSGDEGDGWRATGRRGGRATGRQGDGEGEG